MKKYTKPLLLLLAAAAIFLADRHFGWSRQLTEGDVLAMLTNNFNISFVPFVVFSNMYHPLTIHTSGKFSKCTHFGERRTADRFGSTHIIIAHFLFLLFLYFLNCDR